MNTPITTLALSVAVKDPLGSTPRPTEARCNDLNRVRNVRCQRDTGHVDLHRSGLFVWGTQDPWQPAWRRNLRAKALDYAA